MSYDVIIAGAGPAGSAAAYECARQGLKTLCLEEHGTIGYPVQCAGLLSNAAFAECRVSDRSVLNRVTGAKVRSGRGCEILIDTRTTQAVVVDRGALDREMAEAAAEAGAEFRLRTAVYDVRGHIVLTRGVNGHEEQNFDLLIAADGPRSTIARLLGMQRAPVFLAGIQADIAHECDPRFVELYPDASPDFFGWSVPTAANRIRVGLCGRTQVPQRFEALVETFGPAASTNLVTGTLPLGIMPRTYGNRTLFVGDAAGFAKPTSGGGIYTGVRSARHAAAVAAESCEHGRFDDTALAGYEQKWQADFGNELKLGFRLFGMRQRMSGDDIDAFITALNDPSVIRIIEEYFDMDRPGTVIGKLLLNPAMIRLLRPLLLSGLKSLI